jgi:hypothetical protein
VSGRENVLPSEREEKLESRKKKCMPERDRERERGGRGEGVSQFSEKV